MLALGMVLWATGSTVLNSGSPVAEVPFPAPGEGFFLLAYVALAAFVLLDGRPAPPSGRTVETWLDTAVVCGGAASVVGALMMLPPLSVFGAVPLALLLALLYPVLEVLLAGLVLVQVLRGTRERNRHAALIAGGFLTLAAADSTFVANLPSGFYASSHLLDLFYGLGFLAMAAGACARRPGLPVAQTRPVPIRTLLAASAAPLVVLFTQPPGSTGRYLTVPAALTLIAVGARFALALRDGQRVAEAVRLSHTDELTALPNRRAFTGRMDEALDGDGSPGVMLLDLDRFKEINDTGGHEAGDRVLQAVACRVRLALGRAGMLARLGGDEFAVLVPNARGADLVDQAHEVRRALLDPAGPGPVDIPISTSIGIAVRTEADRDSGDLLHRADLAMYEAKASGSGVRLHDPMRARADRPGRASGDPLRRAIECGQLEMWYQPQVEARSRRVVAVEGLVRWRHPTDGLLPPGVFLPDARRVGLMSALTEAVIDLVVADAGRWHQQGLNFRVSLNCAPPELLDGGVLPRLFDALAGAALPADRLLVEITEGQFAAAPDRARALLLDLRHRGVQSAIDDFGVGAESLARLRDLPAQELKVDRAFVTSVGTDRRSRAIVGGATGLAHSLGMRVVAEGVEDAAAASTLAELGVDLLQGHHLARPMPATDVAFWVASKPDQ
jgi:diguanylate cyclase